MLLSNFKKKFNIKTNHVVICFLFLFKISACATKSDYFYVKSRNPEELKIKAFEICGRNFEAVKYEEDTVIIKCKKQN